MHFFYLPSTFNTEQDRMQCQGRIQTLHHILIMLIVNNSCRPLHQNRPYQPTMLLVAHPYPQDASITRITITPAMIPTIRIIRAAKSLHPTFLPNCTKFYPTQNTLVLSAGCHMAALGRFWIKIDSPTTSSPNTSDKQSMNRSQDN